MREIELKLGLDAGQERALRRSQAAMDMSTGPARTQSLVNTYFDTPDRALSKAGIALRIRRAGRKWLQTVKKKPDQIVSGLSDPIEDEVPLPRNALDLSLIRDDDLREEVIGLARAGLEPVAETRFRRTTRALKNGVVSAELAIDVGTLAAGGVETPFREAELEAVSGTPRDLYLLGAKLLQQGPVRFSPMSKSQRALALADPETSLGPQPRKARPVVIPTDATVEAAARIVLGEYFAHAAPNLGLIVDSDHPGGPHQFRVGLRRLRSALTAFRPVLGREALEPWAESARDLAAEAGRLRDLDVLEGALVARVQQATPEDEGFARLNRAIETKREAVRASVRKALCSDQATAFSFGFAGFLAGRGWLDPSDHGQTARLAQPIRPFVAKCLTKRWKAAGAYGARIAELTIEERHELRKELKKLRYTIDAFRSLYDQTGVDGFLRAVKTLQKAFGALNDAAMAEALLADPDAPWSGDPLAQRAAGRTVGYLASESDRLWPQAIKDWAALAALPRFWKAP